MNNQPQTQGRVHCTVTGCTTDFARSRELKRHLSEKHGEMKLCPFCSWNGAKRAQRLKEHLKKHHSIDKENIPLEIPSGFLNPQDKTGTLYQQQQLAEKNPSYNVIDSGLSEGDQHGSPVYHTPLHVDGTLYDDSQSASDQHAQYGYWYYNQQG